MRPPSTTQYRQSLQWDNRQYTYQCLSEELELLFNICSNISNSSSNQFKILTSWFISFTERPCYSLNFRLSKVTNNNLRVIMQPTTSRLFALTADVINLIKPYLDTFRMIAFVIIYFGNFVIMPWYLRFFRLSSTLTFNRDDW